MSNKMEQFRNALRNLWDWVTMGGVIKGNLEATDHIIKCAAEEADIPYKLLHVCLIDNETGEVIDEGNIIDMIADHSSARVWAVGLSMIGGSINIRIEEEESEDV